MLSPGGPRAHRGRARRLRLAAEIVATYAEVRWRLARGDVGDVVAGLRAGVVDGQDRETAWRLARRLAGPVQRTLDPLPWDSRCLVLSLVLLRLLARRGVACRLVIGVRPGPTLRAHAWVEHDGRPVLPTLGYPPLVAL